MALSLAAQEAMWLRQFDTEINCVEPEATLIWEDNTGTIAVAGNPVFSKRTKHIQIRYHFVREAVEEGIIVLEHRPSKEMTADILTKPLPRDSYQYLRGKRGLDKI